MGEIFLIRHGQASFGASNYDRLSALGIAQSRALGDWLQETGLTFDAVYSGERERQQHTARLALGDATPLQVDPAFNELDADRLMHHAVPHLVLRDPRLGALFADLQANRDAFRRLFEQVVDEWVGGAWEGAGIGRWTEFAERVRTGVQTLAQRHGTGRRIAVFTSGGPITAMLQTLDAARGNGLDWDIANTSVTRLSYTGDGSLALLELRALPHLASARELVTHL